MSGSNNDTSRAVIRMTGICLLVSLVAASIMIMIGLQAERDRLDGAIEDRLAIAHLPAQRAVLILDNVLARDVIAGLFNVDFIQGVTIYDDHGKEMATLSDGELDGLTTYKKTLAINIADNQASHAGELVIWVDEEVAMAPFWSSVGITFLLTFLVFFAATFLAARVGLHFRAAKAGDKVAAARAATVSP